MLLVTVDDYALEPDEVVRLNNLAFAIDELLKAAGGPLHHRTHA